jgi:hypothetical protein
LGGLCHVIHVNVLKTEIHPFCNLTENQKTKTKRTISFPQSSISSNSIIPIPTHSSLTQNHLSSTPKRIKVLQ